MSSEEHGGHDGCRALRASMPDEVDSPEIVIDGAPVRRAYKAAQAEKERGRKRGVGYVRQLAIQLHDQIAPFAQGMKQLTSSEPNGDRGFRTVHGAVELTRRRDRIDRRLLRRLKRAAQGAYGSVADVPRGFSDAIETLRLLLDRQHDSGANSGKSVLRWGDGFHLNSWFPRWYVEDFESVTAALGGFAAEEQSDGANEEHEALTLAEAARLFADLLGIQPSKPRICTELRKGLLKRTADGRLTIREVAHRAVDIRKKRKAPREAAKKKATHTCPQCGEATHKLIGAAEVCGRCFEANLGLPE